MPEDPQLSDFQTYVRELEEERGFTNTTLIQACLHLGEEVGELFAEAFRAKETMNRHRAWAVPD